MVSQERLLELFTYNSASGHLIRKVTVGSQKANSIAGTISISSGNLKHIAVGIDQQTYYAHRVIWMMVHGEWPEEIDHIDGDGTNNRWSNLRNVSRVENMRNIAISNRNKSGVIGVGWQNQRSKWYSEIRIRGKGIKLYYGDDLFEACCQRKSAEIRYGFHQLHGRH